MLFVSVSILSAQTADQQVPQAKFNYQAVVRDQNHDFNLVMNEAVQVTVEILQVDNADAAYSTTLEGMTNRNGMVSFIIGVQDPIPADIDWNNATIKATFKDAEGTILSEVINPVMPVPLALQSVQDPLDITTEKIVEYLNNQNTDGEDVGEIVTALLNNSSVANALKDSIVNYIKTEPEKVKELSLYFISNATVQDAKDAYNAVTPEVKQQLKEMLVDSIKKNKDLAYEIAQYYLTNTEKDEVKALWTAARENPQFHEIFNAVRDSAIIYVMNHKELMMTVAEYYIKNVLDSADVREIYVTLRDQNPPLYNAMKNKFNDYLESYIGNTYVKACDGVSVCDLKHTLDSLKTIPACPDEVPEGCPKLLYASKAIVGGHLMRCVVTMDPNGNLINTDNLTVWYEDGTILYPPAPQYPVEWNNSMGLYVANIDCEDPNKGCYVKYEIPGSTTCPVQTKAVVLQNY